MRRWLDVHRVAAGWGLFAVTLLLVFGTIDDLGITWDEPPYWGSAQLQVEWAKLLLQDPEAALDREKIFEMWDYDHHHNPHPPLYKTAMAVTWFLGHEVLGHLASLRLSSAILFGLLVMCAFRWGTAAWGGMGGLGAAVSILLMPRLFGHGHLNATETPLMTWWVAANLAGWWTLERDRKQGWILVGLAWGFAAGTKFTGLFTVVPLAVWGLWRDWRSTLRGLPIAALVGAGVCWMLNPMLWVRPRYFSARWVLESLNRSDWAPIPTYYMGQVWPFHVPWHHTVVLTAAVVPLGILALAVGGALVGLRRRDPVVVLAAGTIAFFFALMLLPRAPHHDGIRMFIVVMPFLGLLAGYGLKSIWDIAAPRVAALATTLVFLPAAIQLAWIHPYELAYYSEAVGSVRGAKRLGLETTYWMDTYTGPLLEWMNRELPVGARVFVFGYPLPLQLQQAWGKLRTDLVMVDRWEEADWALVQMRQGFMTRELFEFVETEAPVYALRLQDVPLAAIYRLQPHTVPHPEDGSNE